jgi:hypothetical protein|tara:strand:+ start:43 stop:885 length:843 start_codon:yes stop_codon:yes gene_type:complete
MAKKQTKAYAGDPGDEHVEKIAPVMETPKPTRVEPKSQKTNDGWKIQDRTYLLTDGSKPLSKSIKSAGIYHFDENLGYEREMKYCENQKTHFVDEMKGEMRLSHIVFRAGVLFVPKNKVTLQKLLALHPYNGKVFYELKPQKIAEFEVESIEIEIEALNAAQGLDIDMAEAVMRVELGSRVTKMSSKELKRDLLLYAKRNPSLFLELINDENVHLRNIGIRATEMGLLKLSQDQRTFSWKDTNRKLMNVPFDEHPYSALAAWFKTDEGMEIFTNIEKRLK